MLSVPVLLEDDVLVCNFLIYVVFKKKHKMYILSRNLQKIDDVCKHVCYTHKQIQDISSYKSFCEYSIHMYLVIIYI